MKFTLILAAFLICCSSATELRNRFNRGVQTFEADRNVSENVTTTTMTTTTTTTTSKPLPPSYTVLDWRRYYPFGDKFPDSNHTENVTDSSRSAENNLVYPVYVKVPIRVPVKAYRKPKIVMPRTVRGIKTYRYKISPRYMMVRQLPIRRKFVAYYSKPYLFKRQYIKPVYQKTGIHDLYKKNVYYPLRGKGYEVTEPVENLKNWYDSGRIKFPNGLA